MLLAFGATNAAYVRNNIIMSSICYETGYIKLVENITTGTPLNIVYPCIQADEQVLSMGKHLRLYHKIAFMDKITVEPFTINRQPIKEIKVHISAMKTNNKLKLKTTEIIDRMRFHYKDFYFHNNQILIDTLHNADITIQVISATNGFITYDTIINITTDNINILDTTLLNQNLFNPEYTFDVNGVGGLDNQLHTIFKQALSTRAVNPDIIEKLGIKHCKGILLYGPPGCGKTLVARNIGKLLSTIPPIIINGPELLNKYLGSSEENIRNIFSAAKSDQLLNGRYSKLHIIIFDEFDSLCRSRSSGSDNKTADNVVNQLLSMIDGVESLDNIFIIAMTNRKDLLDPAILRPGRLEYHVNIGLPDMKGRLQILNIHSLSIISNKMIDSSVNLEEIAKITENYTGAELELVVRTAATSALHRNILDSNQIINVTIDDFLVAVNNIKPQYQNSIYWPTKEILESDTFQENVKNIMNSSNKVLVMGTGKTTILSYLAGTIKSSNYLTAMDFINLSAYEQSQLLFKLYKSATSVIIIDDIDMLIDSKMIIMMAKMCTLDGIKLILSSSSSCRQLSDTKFQIINLIL